MIRTEQKLEGVELVVPHWDVKLKTGHRTRNRFFKAMIKKGLVNILSGGGAREHVGMLFVKLAGKDKIRLIIDARR